MSQKSPLPAFLRYLARFAAAGDDAQLPPLHEISRELGIGVSVLREQLEVARALGLVEVRPRTGIRRLAYSFFPAAQLSAGYAIERSPENFGFLVDLRNRLEACYWQDAVQRLTPADLQELQALVERAWEKLRGSPIQIPHQEHRQFHLGIYRRLENPFVRGILEAYWEAYEAVGLSLYADYAYLHEVWEYHQRMLDALLAGKPEAGLQALIAHKDLLYHRRSLESQAGKRATTMEKLSFE